MISRKINNPIIKDKPTNQPSKLNKNQLIPNPRNIIPIAEIIVIIPVSIQGFGVREGTYMMLFSSIATRAQSFAPGFSNQIVKVVGSILGGIIYMVSKSEES